MDFGQNLMLIRKQKKLSQADLGKIIGTSGDVIGRYERGDITPSVDVVAKIADALDVSVDYIIGKTKLVIDKNTLNRIEQISNLPDDKKSYVFNLIDMCLRDFKTKKAYAG
ncbi:MAG: helix-turn-helix transcriptional regulator [Saprospiraceae bacterium]|nr:helix-turn-helix transcriptional regulator [Saprospiraceae bacterium]